MIEYTDNLSLESLNRLLTKETLVLCVKQFKKYSNEQEIAERLKKLTVSLSYSHENSLVTHIGNSSYEIDMDEQRFEGYYNKVDSNNKILSALFEPHPSPVAFFIKELAQIWLPGIKTESLHNREMFAGIIRTIHKNSAIHAHLDNVAWSNPKSVLGPQILGQLGMNFFLQVPEQGGDLILWDYEPSYDEFHRISDGNFYIPIEKLPTPTVRVKPEKDMLVLLNARKLHAIEPTIDRDRIAVSCFLGFYADTKPLTYWS